MWSHSSGHIAEKLCSILYYITDMWIYTFGEHFDVISITMSSKVFQWLTNSQKIIRKAPFCQHLKLDLTSEKISNSINQFKIINITFNQFKKPSVFFGTHCRFFVLHFSIKLLQFCINYLRHNSGEVLNHNFIFV